MLPAVAEGLRRFPASPVDALAHAYTAVDAEVRIYSFDGRAWAAWWSVK
jgi:hypothetical protein